MPELPEIEILRETLADKLKGRQVETAELLRHGKTTMHNRDLLPAVAGQHLETVDRYGKMLGLHFDKGLSLVLHLMLIGRIGVYDGERTPKDAILHLAFEGPVHVELVRVAARDLAVMPTDEVDDYPPIKKQGPDALAITADEFAHNLRKTRGPVKNGLMDQEVVAGIGNAYADEIMYAARMHPFTTVQQAGDEGVGRVYQVMTPTLRSAIEARAAAEYLYGIGKALGLAKKHDVMKVHNKEGEPCPECGQPVTLVEKGGRGTYFCAHCQPAP